MIQFVENINICHQTRQSILASVNRNTKVHIHVFPPEQKLDLLQTLALGLRNKQEAEYDDGRQTPAEYPESSGLWD